MNLKRLPVIRHIRFFYLDYMAHRWARIWGECGIGLGQPNPSDLAYLKAVWEGKE